MAGSESPHRTIREARRPPEGLRILFVVPNVPSPIRVRPYSLLRRLSTRHEVHLICLQTQRYEEQFLGELGELCRTLIRIKVGRYRGAWNCGRALLSGIPLRLAYFFSAAAKTRIEAAVFGGQIDMVHVEHAKSIPLTDGSLSGPVPVVCDAVDCLSLYFERKLESVVNPVHRAIVFSELTRVRRYEEDRYRGFDRVFVSSSVDAERMRAASRHDLEPVVLPNGVDLNRFTYQPKRFQDKTIVFASKLDYFPNSQAAQYLVREIMPLVWRRHPDAQLLLVGSNPPRAVRRLVACGRVEVTGFVPDIRPYLAKAAVAVAPIQTKAGTQFKILEAMAIGTPVVATKLACQGLHVTPGIHLLAGDDAQELAAHVALLLEKPKLAQHVARSGRDYVSLYHNWDAIAEQLEQAYADVIEGRQK